MSRAEPMVSRAARFAGPRWRGIDVINAHARDPAQYRRGMQEAVRLIASSALLREAALRAIFHRSGGPP